MRVRQENQGAELHLEEEPIGRGGEATIFAVAGRADVAAKLYLKPTAERAAKLTAMIAAPPADPMASAGHRSITWPLTRLFGVDDGARFVGYLMPRIDNARLICEFCNPGPRLQHTPLFHYGYLLRTARNLAAAVRVLHERGYVIGDLNDANILVNSQALVSLVDTDSFQVRTGSTLYRCRVGRAEYTPPELQGARFADVDRTPEHDGFGLAVVIFRLLMQGTHPFAGVAEGRDVSIPARIRGGYWPYSIGRELPVRPSPHAPPWDILAPHLQSLFRRCFEDGHAHPHERPDAEAWRWALADAERELTRCPVNPQHHFHRGLDVCPWCTLAVVQGRDPFPTPEMLREVATRPGTHPEVIISEEPAKPVDTPPSSPEPPVPRSMRPRRRDVTLAVRDLLFLIGIAAIVAIVLWMFAAKARSKGDGDARSGVRRSGWPGRSRPISSGQMTGLAGAGARR